MANSVSASAPAWMDGVAVNGAQMRREVLGAMYANAGIVHGLAAVALPTPAMKVRLPSGLSLVDDGTGGYYPLDNATQVDLDIAPSSATQARYDSIVGQIIDNGNNTSSYVYRIVSGSPAGSPTPPALPPADAPTALCERIADVYIQANAESNGFVRAQDVSVKAATAKTSADTGWITFPYAAGMTASASNPAYRKIGNRVHLKGMVKPTSNTDITVQTVLGTLPPGFVPVEDRNMPCATEWRAQNSARLFIQTTGAVTFMPAVAVKWVSLDDTSFFVD
jgi:hypothetical protein